MRDQYEAARRAALELGDAPELFPALWGLWIFYLVSGSLITSQEIAERLLGIANERGLPELRSAAHTAYGASRLYRGFFADAYIHLRAAAAEYDPERDRGSALTYGQDLFVAARGLGAFAAALLGKADDALAEAHEGVAWAEHLEHPFTLCYALEFLELVHELRGEGEPLAAGAERKLAIAREQAFPFWVAGGLGLLGRAHTMQGRAEEGCTLAEQGLAAWRATGAELAITYHLGLLADALRSAGRIDEALMATDEAMRFTTANDEHYWEPQVLHVQAECHLLQGQPIDQVEPLLRQALRVARDQGNCFAGLRSARLLVRLLADAGRQAEATSALTWATEAAREAQIPEGLRAELESTQLSD
ncbi:MAG: hypothetical protein ACREKS_21005 [Candidatus Rokuibacteriota bacterium]